MADRVTVGEETFPIQDGDLGLTWRLSWRRNLRLEASLRKTYKQDGGLGLQPKKKPSRNNNMAA